MANQNPDGDARRGPSDPRYGGKMNVTSRTMKCTQIHSPIPTEGCACDTSCSRHETRHGRPQHLVYHRTAVSPFKPLRQKLTATRRAHPQSVVPFFQKKSRHHARRKRCPEEHKRLRTARGPPEHACFGQGDRFKPKNRRAASRKQSADEQREHDAH